MIEIDSQYEAFQDESAKVIFFAFIFSLVTMVAATGFAVVMQNHIVKNNTNSSLLGTSARSITMVVEYLFCESPDDTLMMSDYKCVSLIKDVSDDKMDISLEFNNNRNNAIRTFLLLYIFGFIMGLFAMKFLMMDRQFKRLSKDYQKIRAMVYTEPTKRAGEGL
ncbi:MAG: hypothetical protein V3W04_13800 [Gammaproteobacteria bacterium]